MFTAFQGEGREWVRLFSRATLAKFDYVFTDAMTWTDDCDRRMRLWIADERGTDCGFPTDFHGPARRPGNDDLQPLSRLTST